MKTKKTMNMVIAQSGGPSMVINGSLVAAVIFAKEDGKGRIGKILGARHGIAGILKGEYTDLRKVPFPKLRGLITTPSSALGSCRLKPTPEDCRRIFEEFRRRDVKAFWIPHALPDCRTVSRAEIRRLINDYMSTVMHEEPLDPSLLDFDDSMTW